MKHTMLLAAIAAIFAVSCQKDPLPSTNDGITVSKIIHFSIQQAKDYSDPVYDGVQAELKLAIARVRKADGQTTMLWDSTIAFQSLRAYPRTHIPAGISKSITGINDNTESLQASYQVRYRDAQNQVSMKAKNEFAHLGTSVLTMPVRL